jgi:copper homeostasis protein
MKIEIVVFNLESAIIAAASGAHRIELCSAPACGGLTPSFATIKLVKKYANIPVHLMVRPREGDFCYTKREIESMFLDIEIAKNNGIEGVVIGVLNPDGTVNETLTAKMVEAAYPMNVTFHRAFDMARDQEEALQTILHTGCTRILSAGGKQCALDGAGTLKSLIEKAGDNIIIMPGGGVNEKNIKQLAEITSAKEIHLSARKVIPGKMQFKRYDVSMASDSSIPDFDLQLPDKELIRDILKQFS